MFLVCLCLAKNTLIFLFTGQSADSVVSYDTLIPIKLQMNIRKIIYLNCGVTYEDMIDHRSYVHN